MSKAIRSYMIALSAYPSWREWVQEKVSYTLHHVNAGTSAVREEFVFPPDLEKQHEVVYQYLGLQQTIATLKEIEHYFRTYSFREAQVTRANHLTNICEMYFGRFYEFKERLKRYFEVVKSVAAPEYKLQVGSFIKLYERTFENELRARHAVHHNSRFQDLAIDRIFLLDSTFSGRTRLHKQLRLLRYKSFADEWIRRVRRQGRKMDEFLEAVADATLRTCRFLALYALVETIAECRHVKRNLTP